MSYHRGGGTGTGGLIQLETQGSRVLLLQPCVSYLLIITRSPSALRYCLRRTETQSRSLGDDHDRQLISPSDKIFKDPHANDRASHNNGPPQTLPLQIAAEGQGLSSGGTIRYPTQPSALWPRLLAENTR